MHGIRQGVHFLPFHMTVTFAVSWLLNQSTFRFMKRHTPVLCSSAHHQQAHILLIADETGGDWRVLRSLREESLFSQHSESDVSELLSVPDFSARARSLSSSPLSSHHAYVQQTMLALFTKFVFFAHACMSMITPHLILFLFI